MNAIGTYDLDVVIQIFSANETNLACSIAPSSLIDVTQFFSGNSISAESTRMLYFPSRFGKFGKFLA